MYLYTTIRKRDSKSKYGVEGGTYSRLVVPRLLWNSCLCDNAATVRAAITTTSRDGVDGSGTRGLGLRSVKGDEGKYREEIH